MNRDFAKDANNTNWFGFDLGYDKVQPSKPWFVSHEPNLDVIISSLKDPCDYKYSSAKYYELDQKSF